MKLAKKRSAVAALPLLAVGVILLWLPAQTSAQRRGSGGGEQAEGSAAPTAADTADPSPPGNAEAGKKLWSTVGCYQCHGYSAQGGAAGARLAPNTPPFAPLVKYVRSPKGEMPPYTSKVLSDAQLADIYAFLKSIPKPPDAKDIPALSK